MLIFDELKKNDPQLRLLAVALTGGLFILLAGLWWVQVVSARKYESHLETQSYRTVRIPAVRGKILDRDGRVLAENRPRYSLSLYLDDLRRQFDATYGAAVAQARAGQKQRIAAQEKKLGRSLTKAERKQFSLATDQLKQLREQSRFRVADSVVEQVGQRLGQPLVLDPATFKRHYDTRLALPYPLLPNLNETQIARFEEQYPGGLGVVLDLQPARSYPCGTTAAHLLGYVLRDDSSKEGEDAYPFNYYMPDYRGQVGVEAGFDAQLRGRPGAEAVLVNNLGYRQTENVGSQAEPGDNVVLTIDLDIQQAAERSLAAHQGADARAAVVVMDVRRGDLLAMVSSPAINPDYASNELAHLNDPKLRPQINRATYENYAPGSIFKPIVGLAALENGLDPNAVIYNPENPDDPGHGYYKFSASYSKRDTAPPGDYNFQRAIVRSCNTYFITVGLRAGIENIVRLAEKFHFGERMGLPTRQETRGIFPTLEQVNKRDWRDGNTADVCIGQEIDVTPMQMAVAYSAIANGGKVLQPRFVERIQPQDPAGGEAPAVFPSGVVRDELGVHPRSLKIVRDAMLSETEDAEGTGRAAVVPGLRICGKTGTAQVKNEHGQTTMWNYWFASFAPYENPRYAVIVMVQSEGRGSGGIICAPIAHDIYQAILKSEKPDAPALTTVRRRGAAN
jgi:penicillin-binding protein 2